MRTLIFGGSFDPVHTGHLFVADEALHALQYDRVLFVPAHQSPLKGHAPWGAAHHRVAMLKLATTGRREFQVSTVELDRQGQSYTIDTIRTLQEDGWLEGRPGLLIGDDQIADFDKWKAFRQLRDLVDLVVVGRELPRVDDSVLGAYRRVDNALIPISSSEIRRRISAGEPVRYLLHDKVYEYIVRHAVYNAAHRD